MRISAVSSQRAGDARTGRLHQPAPNRHVLHPRVIVPQLLGQVAAGESRMVCVVLAMPDPSAAHAIWEAPPRDMA